MIGIKERVGYNLPGFIPRKVFVVNKDTHQLGYCKSGMGLNKKLKR